MPTAKKTAAASVKKAAAKKAPAKSTTASSSAKSSSATGKSDRAAALKQDTAKVSHAAEHEETKAAQEMAAKVGKVLDPADLPYRDGETPWTEEDVNEVRAELELEIGNHQRSIDTAEAELRELLSEGTEGAGRDPADVGAANFERDQEMSLAANAREMLEQTRQALRSLELGNFGSCESCGNAIGKGRLTVYPRATMCVSCKQRHERR